MVRLRTLFSVTLLLLPVAAAAAPTVQVRVGTGAWSRGSVANARAGQLVEVRVDAPTGATVRWFELLPDLGKDHHNAEWPWNPGAYRWLGFERVACERVEIEAWRGRSTVSLPEGVPPPLPAAFTEARPWLRRRDVGTFWLQAQVGSGARVEWTPGPEQGDARGLPLDAVRISVREGDGFLGWVATFFNVPSVFGSTPHQSRNWLGADCADVVMTARAAWLSRALDRDWNVGGVVTSLRRRAEVDLVEGVASKTLRWGADVRAGDVVAVRFPGGRAYQHVGVLHSDADGDGTLGPGDLVLHAGPLPLQLSVLGDGPFDGHVLVLDPAG